MPGITAEELDEFTTIHGIAEITDEFGHVVEHGDLDPDLDDECGLFDELDGFDDDIFDDLLV